MPTAQHQVDAFIEALPLPRRRLAEAVRALLFQEVPMVEEHFSFRLPFYHFYGMFCYLHVDKTGLHLCFCRGKDLVEGFPQLEQKGRAAIASVTLHQMADLERLELPLLIRTAAEWNAEAKRLKVPMVRRKG